MRKKKKLTISVFILILILISNRVLAYYKTTIDGRASATLKLPLFVLNNTENIQGNISSIEHKW